MWVGNASGQLGQHGVLALQVGVRGNARMRDHGADPHVVVFELNVLQLRQVLQVDQVRGLGQSQAHGGQQTLTACQQLCLWVLL